VRPSRGTIFVLCLTGCGGGGKATPLDAGDKTNDAKLAPDDGRGSPDAPGAAELLELPFSHRLTSERLIMQTDGGDVYVSAGPWGAHFLPNTGHLAGNAKSDVMGFFTADLGAPLTDLAGGPCDPGEQCQMPEAYIRARIPTYVAPYAGVVTHISLAAAGQPLWYFDRGFRVSFETPSFKLDYDIGQIVPSLRDAVLAATCAAGTCIDTDTWAPGGGVTDIDLNLALAAGDPIGLMNVRATQVGTTAFYTGNPGFAFPFVNSELIVYRLAGGAGVCLYDLIDPSDKAQLQAALERDMLDAGSFRYGTAEDSNRWQWAAEGLSCLAHSTEPADASALYTKLGGWIERLSDGEDEAFVYTPIAKSPSTYDASLYDSANVDHLVAREPPKTGRATPFSVFVAGAGSVMANTLYGEVLDDDGQTFLIKWRDVYHPPGPVVPVLYERAAYLLDSTGLRVRWGDGALTEAGVPAVAPVAATDVCDGDQLVCYDHHNGTHPF
jgi:hypothetical protein